MSTQLKHLFIFLLAGFLFTSCEKELSVENGGIQTGVIGGTAVYTLAGSPGTCTAATISGIYKVGTALDVSNSITISVNVTTIGTYTVSTNTLNGISFTGAGAFITTGEQTITLTGSGTALAAGTFTYAFGANGCSFTIAVAATGGGSSGSSTFAFAGAPGECTSPIINGTYVAGTLLTSANTVTVSVNVTVIGTYTITTGILNGISFSGSGNFTNTGTQTVILTGSGLPVAVGLFDFVPGINGCSFSITVNPGGASTGMYYYKVTVDGTNFTQTANVAGYGYVIGIDGQDSVVLNSGVTPIEDPIPLGKTYLIISKGKFYDYSTATDIQFKDFFSVGAYQYAPVGWVKGISIEWADGTGKYWKTDNAPGTQDGSTFNITATENDPVEDPKFSVKVTIEFSCKVYDDLGNSKTRLINLLRC